MTSEGQEHSGEKRTCIVPDSMQITILMPNCTIGLSSVVSYIHAGSGDDQTVPSNPELLTQTDEILQPCLSCQLYLHVTYHVLRYAVCMHGKQRMFMWPVTAEAAVSCVE